MMPLMLASQTVRRSRMWLFMQRRAVPGAKGSRDMSKVRCFACHKTGLYASQCPKKKKNKNKESEVVATTSDEIGTFVWLVFLSALDMGLELHVQSGVHTMHAVKGVGCVRFQLE